ncbi:recombinase family protein [Bailinhaonella thermotolerans]|uniref:Recombinase family protein n=1 Tax=Bailinhaonella thermotolerans TaxID=1070861 RepID=A0A3A4ATF2_9ACTN|nr:recombinase family protein [Bailinhaonella thermotolerans]RJL31889.1 recombinase family protein [Bailinhaonella thermotolerans]
MIDLAFWGRCSTEDRQEPEASRAWQLRRAKALVEPQGGRIVAEYFDIDESRSIPPQRRPEASRLLASLGDAGRGFDAVVVGEPQRAFYGNQFGLTIPLFEHYKVPLWVPEVGGPIDPANEAHELIMSMFGGISKGERNRIKMRVRTAMSAQAQIEGRFLGGRPPYGYRLADLGPHPNPAKAADGKRLHGLVIDPEPAEVVRRIFREYIAGYGIGAIAEGLTKEGISSPSAYDPARNRHRNGIAWSKFAIRAILLNPRYTGYQVWNKQRTDEVLLDVQDVALGHTAKMRWNHKDTWIWSERPAHEPIIPMDTFQRAQGLMAGRARAAAPHKPHRARHDYVLRGCMYCGVCHRRMEGHWTNKAPYYRCRFPQEYAIANKLDHPRNVCLREDAVLPHLDRWLAEVFAPTRIEHTIEALAAAAGEGRRERGRDDEARRQVAECDRKLQRYKDALDAGADPLVVTEWIKQTQAERHAALAKLDQIGGQTTNTREQIAHMIRRLGDMVAVLTDAEPEKKSDLYRGLGLRAEFDPETKKVRAEVTLDPAPSRTSHWDSVGVRGGT